VKVFLRADASLALGSGHVMRCLTLARALALRGAQASFICREYPGHLCDFIEQQGFTVHRLPPLALDSETAREEDARESGRILERSGGCRWLVVDHYALGAGWESRQRDLAARILVIDDLADRAHDCDLLLDQNLYRDPERRYLGLVPPGCRTILGPRHALLRPEFGEARRSLSGRDGRVRRLLVSFGGSDPTGETGKALAALKGLAGELELEVTVVLGASNPERARIEELCAEIPGCSLHCQVSNMAQLMAAADLALGSGGATTWERCYLGLPSLTVVVAENQRLLTETAAEAGVTWNLGWSRQVSSDSMAAALKEALGDPARVKEMGEKALAVMGIPPVDGTALIADLMSGADHDLTDRDEA